MSELHSPARDSHALAPQPGSGQMFDGIARRYDLLNRLMSFGLDRRWRKKTVRALALGPEAHVLDLATGTGDVALTVARMHPDSVVVGVDPSVQMLEVGRGKIAARSLEERVSLALGDAQSLPFDDDCFDGVTIAFGIRNVPDRARALAEMARVTRPGGRVAILELSEPRRGLMGALARFHIHTLVPRMGALLSGSREYRYLQTSIAAFPPPEQFAAMMGDAGMDVVAVRSLSFGACHLFVGTPRSAASPVEERPPQAPGATGGPS
ncbi:bifunctional demethylmenaquinone methyltransferase/2-methoxy-6-polyprenyl-1,4-benzoquinol methylase UbiE [Haliangium sp.]|uniref:bifunctional demethylmenaquinone methyltransferase/2-methoxy-6-polyprenyl-1,4-benzoquinol methylase UbiE n=1 Tax=Haliangium sp. TaxID=2663208 RepID=UPI003D14F614